MALVREAEQVLKPIRVPKSIEEDDEASEEFDAPMFQELGGSKRDIITKSARFSKFVGS